MIVIVIYHLAIQNITELLYFLNLATFYISQKDICIDALCIELATMNVSIY